MLISNSMKRNAIWPPMPSHLDHARSTPWAHRFTLLAMFVYVAKIADVLPPLSGLGLGKILIGLAIGALILEGGGWREGLLRNPILRPFLGIIFFVLAAIPFAIWPGNSFNYLTDSFAKEVVFIFLLILTTRTYEDIRRVIWTLVLNALVLDYVFFKYGLADIVQTPVGRNEIAMVSVMALGLLLPLKTEGMGKLLKVAGILTLIAAVLTSASRGGYLGLAFVLATFMYFRLGKKIGLTAMALIVIAYLGYLQLPSDVRTNIDSIINYEQDYNVTAPEGRMEIWKRGIRIIYENPILGVGINNFAVAEGQLDAGIRRPWMTAHNSPLQVAAEIGIPGMIIYFILISRLFSAALRLRKESHPDGFSNVGTALFIALVGYMAAGFFLSQGFSVVFYIIMAMSLSGERIISYLKARDLAAKEQ